MRYFSIQTLFFSFLLAVFFLSGCATSDDMGKMQWQMNELKSDVKNIKQKQPGQKDLLQEQQATSSAVADLLLQVQSLQNDVQVLNGRFEEARYVSEKNVREFKESNEQLSSQVHALEISVSNLRKRLDTPVYRTQPATRKPESGSKTVKQPDEKEQKAKDAYMEAYQVYKANNLEKARGKFQALLDTYPENEFSDNAQFWIGETYFKEKNYENAILAYDALLKKYPKSDKTPGALLKQGLAFFELKKNSVAKTILQDLIKKYPNSKQAQIAKRKLAD
jgi:tol-pal system protein YbgF